MRTRAVALALGLVLVLAGGGWAAGPSPMFPVPPPIPPYLQAEFQRLGVHASQWQSSYDLIADTIGRQVRALPQLGRQYGPLRFYGDQAVREVGRTVSRGQVMRQQILQIVRSASQRAGGMASNFRLYLSQAGQYAGALRARLHPNTIQFLNQQAYLAGGAAGAGAAGAGGAGGAAGGGIGAWMSRMWSSLRGLGSSGTALSLMSYMAVAGATQATIQMCLTQYEGEMRALGNAAERRAYNRLVEMMVAHLQDGSLELPEGMTMANGIRLLRKNYKAGRPPFSGFRSRLVVQRERELSGDKRGWHVIWSNDVGWLHVGTYDAFEKEKKRPRGREIWGGRSKQPLKPVELAGPFRSMEEAIKAVGRGVGKATRAHAPLAFPKVYYVGTFKGKKLKLGFEIVRHAAFKPYLP